MTDVEIKAMLHDIHSQGKYDFNENEEDLNNMVAAVRKHIPRTLEDIMKERAGQILRLEINECGVIKHS